MINITLALLAHESKRGVLQNRYFPLSIGLIKEFIEANIKDVKINLFKRPSLLTQHLEKNCPDIVMLGNYMWTEKLNCFYAKSIKKIYPNTLVVFGGPNLSLDFEKNVNFLKENSFIDFLIDGDAEIAAKNIVSAFIETKKNIEETKLLNIPNTLSISKKNSRVIKGEEKDFRLGIGDMTLDNIPSPYLSGAMDIFFEDGSIPLLESNRGCPYSCTFCQQGTKYFSKIRYYNDLRIKEELLYIAKKIKKDKIKMSIVEFTDPNFGMYKNDTKIFQHIREVQNKFDYPESVWCSSGKSQPDKILNNAKILKKGSIMIRATVQSMNEVTLKNIERKNLPVEIFRKMASEGVETYSDIMLALPGETKETHINGIFGLIDSGIDEFAMLQTILLKGTPMEKKEYIKEHDLNTKFRIIPECDGVYKLGKTSLRVTETEEIIYKTKTLSFKEYLDCRKFNLLVMIFHNTRLLRPIYRYLDNLKINRSIILSNILKDLEKNHYDIKNLLDQFMLETSKELSDKDLFFDENFNIESISSNKISKYLTLSLLNYKSDIIKLVESASNKVFENKEDLKEILNLLDKSFLSELSASDKIETIKLNNSLQKVFKVDQAKISLSNFQKDQINMLLKMYKNKSDIESKIAYHLRPMNMIKNINLESKYINITEKKQSHQVELYD